MLNMNYPTTLVNNVTLLVLLVMVQLSITVLNVVQEDSSMIIDVLKFVHTIPSQIMILNNAENVTVLVNLVMVLLKTTVLLVMKVLGYLLKIHLEDVFLHVQMLGILPLIQTNVEDVILIVPPVKEVIPMTVKLVLMDTTTIKDLVWLSVQMDSITITTPRDVNLVLSHVKIVITKLMSVEIVLKLTTYMKI
jgi:hypothetical protein